MTYGLTSESASLFASSTSYPVPIYLKPQEQKRMLWSNVKLILVLSDKGLSLYNFPDYTLSVYHRYEEGVKIVPNESIPPYFPQKNKARGPKEPI
jgi:hypothetical protein